MPKQSEIDRMIVLLYRSNSAHDFTNYVRPAGWLDKLPMSGLDELADMFSHMSGEVHREIEKRKSDGIPKFSRSWHDEQEAARASGAGLLAQIGVKDNPAR